MRVPLRRPGRVASGLLALALAAGAVDAASYLGLGRVFTANMTGNTVLLGVALARGSGGDAARSAAALGGFCLGVVIGVSIIRGRKGTWPLSTWEPLVLEAAALAGLLVAWAAVGVGPARYALIAVSGLAMGAQTAAARAAPTGGVNTTYVTGTLTNAIARLVEHARLRLARRASVADRPATGAGAAQGPALPGGVWLTYAVGAVGGAFGERAWHSGVIAVPLAIVCGVLATALWRHSRVR
jgi:uncharacterized membrane protein YoaK (UPF0700 family)